MGFLKSIARFFATLFGLAEGGTQRATDNLLTSSPDAIRNQFRKTREDSIRDYNEMKNSVADLISIRNERATQLQNMHKKEDELTAKMKGAIDLYKKSQDEALRVKYGQLAEEKTKLEADIDALDLQVKQQEQLIEQYKSKLQDLQKSIESLKNEEAETVADIVSTRKITELNNKLQGLSTDTQTKNLEAIREARAKAKSLADLSGSLSGQQVLKLDQQLLTAGTTSKHLDEFDQAVNLNKLLGSTDEPKKPLPSFDYQLETTTDSKVQQLDSLFK